jgi:hypothetical protein
MYEAVKAPIDYFPLVMFVFGFVINIVIVYAISKL